MGPLTIEVGNHFTRSRQRSRPVVASTAYTIAISSAKNNVATPSEVLSRVSAEWIGASAANDQRTQPLSRSSASRCVPLLPRNTVSPATTGCERMVLTAGSAIDHCSSSRSTFLRSMTTPSACRMLLRPRPQFCRPVTGTGVSREQARVAIQASRFASSSAASHFDKRTRCSGLRAAACGCILPSSIAIRIWAAGSRRSVSVGGALVSGTSWQIAQAVL